MECIEVFWPDKNPIYIYKLDVRTRNIFKKQFWCRYYWEYHSDDPREGYLEKAGFAITRQQAINDSEGYIRRKYEEY